MGLGAQLRDIQYVATNTDTGDSQTYTVLTGMGILADWHTGSYRGAMGVPGLWRGANLLADTLGGLPWHAYEDDAAGVVRKVSPTPDYLEQPSPPDSRVTTLSSLALDQILEGNSIEVVSSRGRNGEVTSTVPVPARLAYNRRARASEKIYRPGEVVYDIDGTELRASEVIHTKGPCEPGALRGMGVLECHRAGSIELALEQARQAGNLDLSSVPTGTLKTTVPDLTKVEAEALKAAWQKSQRDRTVAVLNGTTDFEPIAWNPTETQLLDARKFSLLEMALILGLDPSWLGAAQTSRVYSNIEQEAINYIRYSAFAGHLARFEGSRTRALPPGQWAKANLDALLRADTLSRYQAHQIGVTSGFLAPDEARALEDRPPLTAEQKAAILALQPKPAAPSSGKPASGTRSAQDLHDYWTKGAGLAKWSTSGKPMTTLTGLLAAKPGISGDATDEQVLGLAATYYHDVFGQWPSDGPL